VNVVHEDEDVTPKAASAVVARGLRRDFGSVPAVRGLSLEVARGELLGLVGPDGAGKTTTMRMLAGLVRPTAGTVEVLGVDPFGPDGGRVREVLGLVPQENSLYGDLSVGENLTFFGELFGLSRAVFAERRARLFEITRLGPFVDRRASALSGGMYKKLALACALLHQPRVLLLDEPTNGVDPVSRRELWQLLYELVSRGMSIVLSTPSMDEAVRCHRVALVHEGRILLQGAPQALLSGFDCPVWELRGGVRDAADSSAQCTAHAGGAAPTYGRGGAVGSCATRDRSGAVASPRGVPRRSDDARGGQRPSPRSCWRGRYDVAGL
jgi:ABC-2 type transport system ATP-binding protein